MNLSTAIFHRINTFQKMFALTGLWGVITFKPLPSLLLSILSKLGINLKKRYINLNLQAYKYPLWLRYDSDDSGIFYQIFINQGYSCLEDLEEPKFIIDCGANVGYSSVYFLNKYPNARVIAVEPDHENFKVCEKNLSFYKERFLAINSAVWSHKTGLTVCNDDGRGECAIQVKECQEADQPDIYSIDISHLLSDSEWSSIDLLKIDIEGAETIIFSENYENWLQHVKNIAIELHGEQCEQVFFEALSMYNYELSQLGELTICKNISPKSKIINHTVAE